MSITKTLLIEIDIVRVMRNQCSVCYGFALGFNHKLLIFPTIIRLYMDMYEYVVI